MNRNSHGVNMFRYMYFHWNCLEGSYVNYDILTAVTYRYKDFNFNAIKVL